MAVSQASANTVHPQNAYVSNCRTRIPGLLRACASTWFDTLLCADTEGSDGRSSCIVNPAYGFESVLHSHSSNGRVRTVKGICRFTNFEVIVLGYYLIDDRIIPFRD